MTKLLITYGRMPWKHDIMLYRIDGATVYVEAIYHQLQDYEKTFANELEQ